MGSKVSEAARVQTMVAQMVGSDGLAQTWGHCRLDLYWLHWYVTPNYSTTHLVPRRGGALLDVFSDRHFGDYYSQILAAVSFNFNVAANVDHYGFALARALARRLVHEKVAGIAFELDLVDRSAVREGRLQ